MRKFTGLHDKIKVTSDYLLVEELLVVFEKLVAYLIAMDGLSQLP